LLLQQGALGEKRVWIIHNVGAQGVLSSRCGFGFDFGAEKFSLEKFRSVLN